jgi:hypothetical protein
VTKNGNDPKPVGAVGFADTVKELTRIFARKESQFAIRYKCLKLEKESGEDYDSYAARVNLKGEKFNIVNCTADNIKAVLGRGIRIGIGIRYLL